MRARQFRRAQGAAVEGREGKERACETEKPRGSGWIITRKSDPLSASNVRRTHVQFAVGYRAQGKASHVVVDAEDALIAALKVKMQQPEALIAYVRRENKRGDSRHPMHGLGAKNG